MSHLKKFIDRLPTESHRYKLLILLEVNGGGGEN